MSAAAIDFNCDLGERDDAAGIAVDLALLDLVSSANIACGGHAGDEQSMLRTVTAALERGVALGAHPGYADREGFGRVAREMPLQALEDSIVAQLEALQRVIDRCRGLLSHVKAHGALYHAAMRQHDIAERVAAGVARVSQGVTLVGRSGAPALDVWRMRGFRVAAEAFVDRRYEPDGSLRSRAEADALLASPQQAAAQAVRIARGLGVVTSSGAIVGVSADTICLHSDSPNAIETAREVRAALEREGIRVGALDR